MEDQWHNEWPPAPAYPPDASARRRRFLSLAATAVLALAVGGGAVAIARDLGSDAAAASPASTAPAAGGAATVTELTVLGPVTAVGRDSVTVTGPDGSVTAAVTSATRFTGKVQSLRGVRTGDSVVAQIREKNGVARLVSLQDPAS